MSTIKLGNDVYLDKTGVKDTYLIKKDGTSDGILIAEVNFTSTYQRYSLIFAVTMMGYNDATESGIYNLGISSTVDKNTHLVGYNCIGNASTDRIYTLSSGNNLKIYLKKTSTYRSLNATLLGKSEEIIWKL